jgi:hypothetical protein
VSVTAPALFFDAPVLPAWMLLAASTLIVFVVPGWLILDFVEGGANVGKALDRLPRAFGVSFVVLTAWTVVATEATLDSTTTAWMSLVLTILLVVIRPFLKRRSIEGGPPAPFALEAVVTGMLAVTAVLLWWTGGIYGTIPDGEEALHLSLIRKMHSNPAIGRDNLMYRPGVPSTYLYLPYHLGVALVARLAGVDPLVAYVKLAPLWGLIALTSMGALASALGFGATTARVVTLVATVLAWNGQAGNWSGPFGRLLPYSHHADFSLGVLLPVCLVAVARFVARQPERHEWVTTPALLAAVTIAHTREGVQLLFYLAAIAGGLAVFSGAIRPIARSVALAAALLVFGLGYSRLHQAAVGHIQEWENAERMQARALARRFSADPVLALTGPPLSTLSDRPNYVQNFHSLFHPYFVVGMLIGPILALRSRDVPSVFTLMPMAATLAVVGIPVVSVAMVLTTYSQVLFTPARYVFHFCYLAIAVWVSVAAATIRDLMGQLGGRSAESSLAITLTCGARRLEGALRIPPWVAAANGWPASIVLALTVGGGMVGCAIALGKWAAAEQIAALKALLFFHVIVLVVVAFLRPRLRTTVEDGPTIDTAWAAILAALLLPVTLWTQADSRDLGIVGRVLPQAAWQAARTPASTDLESWYRLRRPLPIPYPLLDDIRIRLPGPKVLAADPRWMWLLPALSNHYVFAYSQYLSTEEPLVAEYARVHGLALPAGEVEPRLYGLIRLYQERLMARFPVFNDRDSPEITARFLVLTGVDYIVSPPEPPLALERALARWPNAFVEEFTRDGWRLYRVRREVLDGPL